MQKIIGAGEMDRADAIEVVRQAASGVNHYGIVYCCGECCVQLGFLSRDGGYDRRWIAAMKLQFRWFVLGRIIDGTEGQ